MPAPAHHRRRLASSIALMCIVASCIASGTAGAAPAGHAAAKGCRPGRVALRLKRPGHAPASLCVTRPPRYAKPAAGALAVERLASSGRLLPAKLRRRLRAFPRRAERAFARAREGQLAHAAQGADGTTTQHSGAIPVPSGQVGAGTFSDTSTASTGPDGVRYTHSSSSRHEAFGPRCADFGGNGVTTLKFVDTDTHTVERAGKRTVIEVTYRDTGRLSWSLTDDFALKGPLKLELDFVIEIRSHTEIAATGKVVSREGTRTQRVAMTQDIDPSGPGDFGGVGDLTSVISGVTLTGGSGPHGVLTVDDFLANKGSLYLMLAATTWLAEVQAVAVFAESIDSMKSGVCVTATASPASLLLPKGQSDSTVVTVKGADDQRALPSNQASNVQLGNPAVDPLTTGVFGPEAGVTYRVTGDGAKGRFHVLARTRRGLGAVDIDITGCGASARAAIRALVCSGRLGGTYSGTADLASTAPGGIPVTDTFSGAIVLVPKQVNLPVLPGVVPPTYYGLESGSLHFKAVGDFPDGCHLLAEGDVDLLTDVNLAQGVILTLTPGDPVTYSMVLAGPLTATVPGAFTGCTNPDNDKALSWSVSTGLPALIVTPAAVPLGPGGSVAGTNQGTAGPGEPQQTWLWNLQPQ